MWFFRSLLKSTVSWYIYALSDMSWGWCTGFEQIIVWRTFTCSCSNFSVVPASFPGFSWFWVVAPIFEHAMSEVLWCWYANFQQVCVWLSLLYLVYSAISLPYIYYLRVGNNTRTVLQWKYSNAIRLTLGR